MDHIRFLKEKFFKSKDVGLDFRENESLIALQGPKAAHILQSLVKQDLNQISFMKFFKEKVMGQEVIFYRTGYTGEDGFEISVPNQIVEQFCDKLFEDKQLKQAGLGARDTLRLEAGLCLHGHEITKDTSPVESLLQWTIRKQNQLTNFWGQEGYLKAKKSPPNYKRTGVVLKEGGVLRENCELFNLQGESVGKLTSGSFSPILNKGIGQGYVHNDFRKEGTELEVVIRKRKAKCEVVKMPFVPQKYFRGS